MLEIALPLTFVPSTTRVVEHAATVTFSLGEVTNVIIPEWILCGLDTFEIPDVVIIAKQGRLKRCKIIIDNNYYKTINNRDQFGRFILVKNSHLFKLKPAEKKKFYYIWCDITPNKNKLKTKMFNSERLFTCHFHSFHH